MLMRSAIRRSNVKGWRRYASPETVATAESGASYALLRMKRGERSLKALFRCVARLIDSSLLRHKNPK